MKEQAEKIKTLLRGCHVCHREIPESAALTSEGIDYVLYFCSDHCHQTWLAQQDASLPK